MKRTKKIVSLLCLVAMLVSTFALTLVSAAEYVMEKPVEASKWENPHFSTDHAYSFAFVGDTQFITIGDYLLGTEKLKQDPQGRDYFWLTGAFHNAEPEAQDTDEWALKNSYVAVVPVQTDMTDYKQLKALDGVL